MGLIMGLIFGTIAGFIASLHYVPENSLTGMAVKHILTRNIWRN